MTDNLDVICLEYIARLEAALADLAPGDRQQIVEQVTEHISSARAALPAQTEAGVRDILERLGTPEEIAAEARTEELAPERRRRRPLAMAGGVAVVLIVLGFGLAAALGTFSGGGTSTSNVLPPATTSTTEAASGASSAVNVPEVLGTQLPSAAESLSNVGLRYRVRDVPSERPIGTVLTQAPLAGSAVRGGTSVALTISGVQTSVTVPNVIGQSQADATATLAAAGLNATLQGPVTNAHVSPGIVFVQGPAAGSRVEQRSNIAITISAGPAPRSSQQ
jgi:hypothetical protein